MRGEYFRCRTPHQHHWELPPRARRIQSSITRVEALQGTTSACAENTPLSSAPPKPKGNYLRVRGEYMMCGWIPTATPELPPRARRILIVSPRRLISWELPPRARRIPFPPAHACPAGGTTSACAENTSSFWFVALATRNYLRVRGEYGAVTCLTRMRGELPPRARRIPPICCLSRFSIGTTSACAENTGEQHASENRAKELPPRARRIHAQMFQIRIRVGTTSACAENTTLLRCARR